MMDIKFIRENVDLMQQTIRNKNIKLDLERLLKLDDDRRALIGKIEELKARKNASSKLIPTMAPEERLTTLEKMKAVDIEQDDVEEKMKPVTEEFNRLMLDVPMITDPRTPVGRDDSENVPIFAWGDIPVMDFQPLSHEQLGAELDIIDFDRAGKVGGSRSYILKGAGARLELGLIKYATDFIAAKGYTLMNVPVIVNRFALEGTGMFPGGEEETYHLEKDDKYLVGTSEVSIGGYYANEILEEKDLPIRFAGFSVCFRREAGSYGKDTHGLYRVHQFLKVEQFIICKNDDAESAKMHEELMSNSEQFLRSLAVPYRILNVCTGDMGKGKFYMNDIESFMPSRHGYGETHSCSNLHDFQARRLNLRYRDSAGKVQYCHTLNNTLCATPRILIPLLELNQNRDASITIPEVLRAYMNNQEKISKK